jgi:diguanylate cyclase (GGDEF)-like protein
MFIDLDNFKTINDSLGHEVGDKVLCAFAKRVSGVLRSEDTLARFGGDEFILLVPGLPAGTVGETIAERINKVMGAPFDEEGGVELGGWRPAASIGVAMATETDTVATLVRNADAAMYLAKESGKGRYAVFTEELRARVMARMEMESEVRQAVKTGQLALHFQPIIGAKCGHVTGLEARVRWNHPRLGMILPGDFLPLVNELGLAESVDKWIFKTACEMMSQGSFGAKAVELVLSVTAAQLVKPGFREECQNQLEKFGVSGKNFCLVISDISPTKNDDLVWAVAAELKALGLRIGMPGNGPIAVLGGGIVERCKLEQNLVSGLGADSGKEKVTRAIIELAHSLGVKVIGTGVETEVQKTKLIEMGCDWLEGFLVGTVESQNEFGRGGVGEAGCDC